MGRKLVDCDCNVTLLLEFSPHCCNVTLLLELSPPCCNVTLLLELSPHCCPLAHRQDRCTNIGTRHDRVNAIWFTTNSFIYLNNDKHEVYNM